MAPTALLKIVKGMSPSPKFQKKIDWEDPILMAVKDLNKQTKSTNFAFGFGGFNTSSRHSRTAMLLTLLSNKWTA